MRRIAAAILLCVFGALLPSATAIALAAPQQWVPICCRAHGAHACIMGAEAGASSDAGPALRQPACPYRQGLRAITTGSIAGYLTSHIRFGIVVTHIGRQSTADQVTKSVPRGSIPRGPPSFFA
jgi:hypothetical protein